MTYKEIPIYCKYPGERGLEQVATIMICLQEAGGASGTPHHRIAVFGGSPHVVEGVVLTEDLDELFDELGE